MLLDTTADRQERDWEGRKVQENTQKKGMKAIQPELIRHFVPHPAINQEGKYMG